MFFSGRGLKFLSGGVGLGNSIIRVLVVDDYAPWRAFVASIFQNQPELQITGKATNGFEAIQIAQQLQPDLILLDIGLPMLDGLAAARRIREVSVASIILFASENRSDDIVEEALRTGARGYVVKSDAASDLLPAVNAVLSGKRFVSASLSGHDLAEANDPQPGTHRQPSDAETIIALQNVGVHRHHEVGFYPDDPRLLSEVGQFIEAALRVGNPAIVVATDSHRKSLLSGLRACGSEISAAIEEGRYFSLDAEETLSNLVVNGVVDAVRFHEQFGDLIMAARETAKSTNPRVAVFGECVDLLWAQGNAEAVIQLEKLGNKLTENHDVDILCGYCLGSAEKMDSHLFQRICAEHSAVYSQ